VARRGRAAVASRCAGGAGGFAGRSAAFGQLDRLVAGNSSALRRHAGRVVLLYLTVDFATGGQLLGRAWGRRARAVLEQGGRRRYQLAPAALIIAAALLATLLPGRRADRLFALGVRPWRWRPHRRHHRRPGGLLFLLGGRVVVRADARAEEIQVKRFNAGRLATTPEQLVPR